MKKKGERKKKGEKKRKKTAVDSGCALLLARDDRNETGRSRIEGSQACPSHVNRALGATSRFFSRNRYLYLPTVDTYSSYYPYLPIYSLSIA